MTADQERVDIDRRDRALGRGDPHAAVPYVVRQTELIQGELQACLERNAFELDVPYRGTDSFLGFPQADRVDVDRNTFTPTPNRELVKIFQEVFQRSFRRERKVAFLLDASITRAFAAARPGDELG